jgi:hypothetical protein
MVLDEARVKNDIMIHKDQVGAAGMFHSQILDSGLSYTLIAVPNMLPLQFRGPEDLLHQASGFLFRTVIGNDDFVGSDRLTDHGF